MIRIVPVGVVLALVDTEPLCADCLAHQGLCSSHAHQIGPPPLRTNWPWWLSGSHYHAPHRDESAQARRARLRREHRAERRAVRRSGVERRGSDPTPSPGESAGSAERREGERREGERRPRERRSAPPYLRLLRAVAGENDR